MYQAACACILLDLKRILQRAYNNKKDKTDFPVEVLPLKCENILNCPPCEDGGLQQGTRERERKMAMETLGGRGKERTRVRAGSVQHEWRKYGSVKRACSRC